jgi:hypothetical protein
LLGGGLSKSEKRKRSVARCLIRKGGIEDGDGGSECVSAHDLDVLILTMRPASGFVKIVAVGRVSLPKIG